MPAGDGTGPAGAGPMTGRAAANGAGPGAAATAEQELDSLKAQAEYLEDALGNIRKRVEELQVKGGKD